VRLNYVCITPTQLIVSIPIKSQVCIVIASLLVAGRKKERNLVVKNQQMNLVKAIQTNSVW
jgi:hypothetical protein